MLQFSSVAQLCLTLCDPTDCSKHARLPCPSPSPGIYPTSCPLSRWCHPTISFSVAPFSSCPQAFPASECLPMSQLFVSGGQSTIQCWFPSGLTSLISLSLQGTPQSLLQHHNLKASIFWCSAYFIVQLSHPYMTTGKTVTLTRWTFVSKMMNLLYNMLSRFVITFLPRSKRLLISWL